MAIMGFSFLVGRFEIDITIMHHVQVAEMKTAAETAVTKRQERKPAHYNHSTNRIGALPK
jgi:hypothetical protein